MSKLALGLIQKAKETGAKTLDLGNCGLTELPDELFELVDLEELYLCNSGWIDNLETNKRINFKSQNKGDKNNIKHLSPRISQLNKIKGLFANGNFKKEWDLKDLSPLQCLSNLQQLYVYLTQASDLSPLQGLSNLQQLDVYSTLISDLSPLQGLSNLQRLTVYSTLISDLSPLQGLSNLQQLSLYLTKVSDLSPLQGLSNLQQLYVSSTKVSDLSPLQGLSNLQQLYVSSTKVSDLSPLQGLSNLQQLDVSSTQVSNLSPLKGLSNLQQLTVSSTKVSDLSPLKGMSDLQQLYVFDTQVSNLSPLKKLIEKGILVKWEKYVEGINVEDCPLENPPIEIVKQGNAAILNYWKQIEAQGGTQTINEAKLIIVGEGGTGKTTLFNKVIDPTFDLHQTPTEETQGINIHEGLEIIAGFRANLWDFGGQELQYMTHQFFLTPKAVYVLMMEARKEAPNLAYWFKIISLLGKDKSEEKVSLLIVLNKKEGSTGMPQYQDLLRIYADDFDYQFIEVDLAINDKRWESLKEAIEQRLINLSIVKNALPKQWKPIREALREEAAVKPYMGAVAIWHA